MVELWHCPQADRSRNIAQRKCAVEMLRNDVVASCSSKAPVAKLVEALHADTVNLAHVNFGLMEVEAKFVQVTRSCPLALQDDVFDLEQVWDQRMLYDHHPALCLAAVTDPNFQDKHGALLPNEECRGSGCSLGTRSSPRQLRHSSIAWATLKLQIHGIMHGQQR
ncbi:hypothetical protein QJQ45_028562 [Haematococcus lacustris]|nr:hypothetical protein QJQ45_028562 [Haematococcus lacustris]